MVIDYDNYYLNIFQGNNACLMILNPNEVVSKENHLVLFKIENEFLKCQDISSIHDISEDQEAILKMIVIKQ